MHLCQRLFDCTAKNIQRLRKKETISPTTLTAIGTLLCPNMIGKSKMILIKCASATNAKSTPPTINGGSFRMICSFFPVYKTPFNLLKEIMDKHEVAKILEEIALLLEVQGENPFKVRAFEKAARQIEGLEEDLATVVKEKRLQDIPGVGEKIAEKITTLVETGHLPYYEDLKKELPESVLQFMQIPGLGAKKVHVLFYELGLKTIDELKEALKNGLVARVAGFGEKTEKNILANLAKLDTYSKRHLYWDAIHLAQPILAAFKKNPHVKKVELAGSIRRKLETIGDLDVLVASNSPEAVMSWFIKAPFVQAVIAKGPTKASIRIKNGMQLDLRVVPEEQFAYALLYFTGSKEHNIALRKRAIKDGLHLSEYGLEPSKTPLKSEREIYKTLKLAYIPPELREDRGEIEAAEKMNLPKLIEVGDLKGTFHCHTTASDGHNTLEEMWQAADEYGLTYFGVADHSKSSVQANGLSEERLFEQIAHIKTLNKSKKYTPYIFSGTECDIMPDGSLDYSDTVLKELDYVVVAIHHSFKMDEATMTKRLIKAIENPYTTILGHLTGRLLLKREGYQVDVEKVVDACIANGVVMELNANPMRLDMDWRYWHKASQKGLKCAINPDAHSTADFALLQAGINIARKGWLEKKHVINTMSLLQIKRFLG